MRPDSLSLGERLQVSFTQIGEYLPRFVLALVLIFAGYLFARAIERKLIEPLLRRIRFNRLLERGGVMDAVERSGSHLNPTQVAGKAVFWTMMFAVLIITANVVGFTSLATVFSELLGYVPSVVAAIAIVIVGILLGALVGGLIMVSAGALRGGSTLARFGRGGVILLAIFMALQELGVATEIVTTSFAILFGAVALALALAFGLGSRELAGEITREWYEHYRAEREAIARDSLAHEQAEEAEELAVSNGEGRGIGKRRPVVVGALADVAPPREAATSEVITS
jgi:Conserved TM helix